MGAIDDILAADAARLTDPDFFPGAEPVTYRPAGKLGADRVVNANVDRGGGLKPLLGSPGVAAPEFTIFVTRADVPSPTKGDQFFLAGDPAPHAFIRVIKQDAAGYLLEIR